MTKAQAIHSIRKEVKEDMRHFLDIADWTPEELNGLLDLAAGLKKEWQQRGCNKQVLNGRVLGMVFQKPSLRTRVSFEVGMMHLGGHALYLSPAEIGLGKRESIADVARVLSRYVQGIMARVFDHQHILELAKYATVPVINGLSNYNHPCQALADVLTVKEHLGQIKGKKIVFLGDGNNVAVSLLIASAKLGAHFTIASPEGYRLRPDVIEKGKAIAAGSRIASITDPVEAVAGADVIYTDTWTSMGQEEEAEKRRKVFPPYQVNAGLVAQAAPGCIVMHCLPAHRGDEITDEVADGPHSVLFDQAENRLHAQKAILVHLMAE
ncbi:MAG: ornithine carbamoyltransferase [Anaerolineae bacterium]|nr:ornithine carbamoyltransferase [Anaerolineae bacterium]